MDIKNKKIRKAGRQIEKEMFKMLAAKKMNEMELTKVAGAGLDTINYILHHQNDKAQANVVLPVPPWAIPHPTPHPHPGPVNPWPIPHPGPFPKPGPFVPKGPVQ